MSKQCHVSDCIEIAEIGFLPVFEIKKQDMVTSTLQREPMKIRNQWSRGACRPIPGHLLSFHSKGVPRKASVMVSFFKIELFAYVCFSM